MLDILDVFLFVKDKPDEWFITFLKNLDADAATVGQDAQICDELVWTICASYVTSNVFKINYFVDMGPWQYVIASYSGVLVHCCCLTSFH